MDSARHIGRNTIALRRIDSSHQRADFGMAVMKENGTGWLDMIDCWWTTGMKIRLDKLFWGG